MTSGYRVGTTDKRVTGKLINFVPDNDGDEALTDYINLPTLDDVTPMPPLCVYVTSHTVLLPE